LKTANNELLVVLCDECIQSAEKQLSNCAVRCGSLSRRQSGAWILVGLSDEVSETETALADAVSLAPTNVKCAPLCAIAYLRGVKSLPLMEEKRTRKKRWRRESRVY